MTDLRQRFERLVDRISPRRRAAFYEAARRHSTPGVATSRQGVNPTLGASNIANPDLPHTPEHSPHPQQLITPPDQPGDPQLPNAQVFPPQAVNAPLVQPQAANAPLQIGNPLPLILDSSNSSDSDSDCDIMSQNMPPVFKGIRSQDVEAWFRHLDLWLSTQRNMSDRAKIASAALLFKDAALHYFESLQIVDPPAPEGAIATYPDFKARVIERFRRDPRSDWQEVALLHSIKQRQGQTRGCQWPCLQLFNYRL